MGPAYKPYYAVAYLVTHWLFWWKEFWKLEWFATDKVGAVLRRNQIAASGRAAYVLVEESYP